jgi:hypothetical protein
LLGRLVVFWLPKLSSVKTKLTAAPLPLAASV